MKWQVWRGKAVDIWSKSPYPADVLSNLCSNGFRFDGMVCGSMEGFLQSLKQEDLAKQRQICSMKGRNARNMSTKNWQTDQIVWWKGKAIDRQGDDFLRLVTAAYKAMFTQNERFRTALMFTRGMSLYHTKGNSNPYKTILTNKELCSILMGIRDDYDKQDRIATIRNKELIQEEKYTIHVGIGNHAIPVAVSESTEEGYRMAAKSVNDKIEEYQSMYPELTIEQTLGAIALKNEYENQLSK